MTPTRLAVVACFSLGALAHPALGQWQGFSAPHSQLPVIDRQSDHIAGKLIDVEGDGDLDLVVVLAYRAWILARNDGNGQFVDASDDLPPYAGALATSLDAGDVDGDGDPDLFIGTYDNSLLFLNDGTGRFTDASSRLPVVHNPTDVVRLGDLDGDGDLDAVLGAYNSPYFQPGADIVYLNDGNGYFSLVPQSIDYGPTTDLDLGDVDGDGDLDVLIGNGRYCDPYGYGCWNQANRLYLNHGNATFSPGGTLPPYADDTRAVRLQDLDGDHDLDILVGNQDAPNRMYLNDGHGVFADFSDRLPAEPEVAITLGACDVDGDGDLDVLVGTTFLDVLINDGSAHFRKNRSREGAGQYIIVLDGGDVDGDGDLDVVVSDAQLVHLWFGHGDGTFLDPAHGRELPGPCKLGDLDGDGNLDAVVEGAENFAYFNDGSGGLTARSAPGSSLHPRPTPKLGHVALGDIDGDGDVDIFDGGGDITPYDGADTGHSHRFYLNDGTGNFTVSLTRLPPHQAAEKGFLVDLDGDGDLDLLAIVADADFPNRLYLNDGSGQFADASANLPGRSDESRDAAFGDVDGDGDTDVFIGNTWHQWYGALNSLFLNDGHAVFSDASSQLPPDYFATEGVELGDVDRDGDLDAVLANYNIYGKSQLYLNDGTGTFTDASSRVPIGYEMTKDVALADFDADGDLDILFANNQADTYYVNDGTGYFTDASDLAPSVESWGGLTVGDIDGDGDLDVLGGFTYVNLARHLSWRGLPRPGRPFDLDLAGSPNGLFFLLWATRTAHLTVPRYGLLSLDPGALFATSQGTLDGYGKRSLTIDVPPDPGLVGLSVYCQALVGSPDLRFTNLEIVTLTDS
jgi:hypothetical protein